MVSLRYSNLVENGETNHVAKLFNILLFIEDVIEIAMDELGIELDNGIEIGNLSLLDTIDNINSIEINIDSNCGYNTIKYLDNVEIRIRCKKGAQYNIDKLYEKIFRKCIGLSISYLVPKIFSESEYALILLGNGKGVVLQGFEKSVRFPKISDTIFLSHTHPYSIYPVFSRQDIFTGVEILSNRGMGICVYSMNGYLCMYRSGIMDEDDYINLVKLANNYRVINIDILRTQIFKHIKIDYNIQPLP